MIRLWSIQYIVAYEGKSVEQCYFSLSLSHESPWKFMTIIETTHRMASVMINLPMTYPTLRGICLGYCCLELPYLTSLFKTLLFDVVLQVVNLTGHCFDSLSESEIIPFSGVSRSGGGSIAQAAG